MTGAAAPPTQARRYRVPFVNYVEVYRDIGPELDAAVRDVLSRGQFILREELERFEAELARFVGVKHVIGVNSGTDALYLSVRAAGIGPGDEVVTVAHTFVATVGAIVHSGATPRLIEISDDLNMDVELLEAAITPRTRAIIPVHLNGRLCRMDRVREIAERHRLVIIEDSAQALGGSYQGVKGGAWGLAGCFSFYPAKILGTAGDAGAVATSDDDFATLVRALRDNGRTPGGGLVGYGFCSRMDNLHAALLLVKLRYLPMWLERRRALARAYAERLTGIPDLVLPPAPADGPFFDVYQNYVVRSPRKATLMDELGRAGVEILVNCPVPLHLYPALGLGEHRLRRTESTVCAAYRERSAAMSTAEAPSPTTTTRCPV